MLPFFRTGVLSMTIEAAITQLDSLKHNTYSSKDKVLWLSRLDAMVKKHILDTHEGVVPAFTGYDDTTDLQTSLLVPAPFDDMYIKWLEAQIDYTNGEYDKYNQSITVFQKIYDSYANFYNRIHMPIATNIKYF